MEQKEWHDLLRSGIINADMVLQQVNMTKEKAVLKVHKYAITSLKDGRYGTYISKESGGRKNIKGRDYNDIIGKLFDIYYPEGYSDRKKKLRLCDIFDDWLKYKVKKKRNCAETKKQNIASYNKYVKGTDIDLMPLEDLKTIDLENWAIDVLTEYDMTARCFNTNKVVVTGPLKYAKRMRYISENPWQKEEMEYVHLFKAERRKPSAEVIFYPDEIELLCSEFENGYSNNGNIANLALKANFELGLRVGELAALQWSDINFENETIFIQRMEDSSGNVVDYEKSDSEAGYRELDLSDEIIDIFKRIKHDRKVVSQFVFSNADGSRANKMQFEHRLAKAEKAIGWKVGNYKYSHCIRRTVASRMDAEGWTLDEIRRWLGHTDVATTYKYLYNPFRESETRNRVKKTSILHTNESCLQLSSKKASNSGQ